MGGRESGRACAFSTCMNLSISCSKLPTGLVPNTLSNGGLLCMVRCKLVSPSIEGGLVLRGGLVQQCRNPLHGAYLQRDGSHPKTGYSCG